MSIEEEIADESKVRHKDTSASDRLKKESQNPRSIGREILSNIPFIVFALLMGFLVMHFVAQRTQVKGPSMQPTLYNNDNLIIDKISYRFRDPERFDIIVFPFQYAEDTYYIKRIIGLPGETIQITEGVVYIDGEVLEEDYGKEVMNSSGRAEEPIELADNEYFVLGDNRNNSTDSRFTSVANIKREDIVGRTWIRIWPLNELGVLKHQ